MEPTQTIAPIGETQMQPPAPVNTAAPAVAPQMEGGGVTDMVTSRNKFNIKDILFVGFCLAAAIWQIHSSRATLKWLKAQPDPEDLREGLAKIPELEKNLKKVLGNKYTA